MRLGSSRLGAEAFFALKHRLTIDRIGISFYGFGYIKTYLFPKNYSLLSGVFFFGKTHSDST